MHVIYNGVKHSPLLISSELFRAEPRKHSEQRANKYIKINLIILAGMFGIISQSFGQKIKDKNLVLTYCVDSSKGVIDTEKIRIVLRLTKHADSLNIKLSKLKIRIQYVPGTASKEKLSLAHISIAELEQSINAIGIKRIKKVYLPYLPEFYTPGDCESALLIIFVY